MLQFLMTMKGIVKTTKEYLKPKILKGLSLFDVRKWIKFFFRILQKLFVIKGLGDAVFKGVIMGMIYFTLRVICMLIKEKQEMLAEEEEEAQEQGGWDVGTSDEFLQLQNNWNAYGFTHNS